MSTLFDRVKAKVERDMALERVEAAANKNWYDTAVIAVCGVATAQPYLTTDDVWKEIHRLRPDLAVREPRALGPAMVQARKQGVIEATAEFVQSSKISQHGRPIRIWRSNVWTPTSSSL